MENEKIAHDTHPVCPEAEYLADPTDAEVPEGFERVIPVVFATNENYAPYAGVAIQSIIENAKSANFYRIYVFHTGLSEDMIQLLETQRTSQLSVRCINVDMIIQSKGVELFEERHVTKETFYRFVIPEVCYFYSRVIYLDCDLIVNRDIADILEMEIGDNLLAAVQNTCTLNRRREVERLHLNVDQYINAGVLVINIRRWIAEGTEEKCFAALKTIPREYLPLLDQDILNVVCQGRIFYMDAAWNYYWHMIYGNPEFVELNRSTTSRIGENFFILHFTTKNKPWSFPERRLSRYFWQYARHSIFYEIILKKNMTCEPRTEPQRVTKQSNNQSILPRKVRGGIQCVRDHGFGYTVRRLLYHMGLWEDEEASKSPENRPK